MKKKERFMKGELKVGEAHPAAFNAKRYLVEEVGVSKLVMYQEAYASTALSGNRLAEICFETLDRLMQGMPVSDRYILGLAWNIRDMEEGKYKRSK